MDPIEIARRLIASTAEAEAEVNGFYFEQRPMQNMQEWLSLEDFGPLEHYRRHALTMMEELSEALAQTDKNEDRLDIPNDERDRWCLGSATISRGPAREILRGFLVPNFTVPILTHVPDNVASLLITIEKGVGYLNRETHGKGWHYHYLDRKKKRSDAILSWDTRWKKTKSQATPALFVEKHGEKRAKIKSKYKSWGPEKRKSIYNACLPDLCKWNLNDFKCASNDSQVVYPLGRQLTPHP